MSRHPRTTRSLIVSLLVFALLALPAGASAEDQEEPDVWDKLHRIELGLYAGAFFPPKSHELYDLDVDQFPLAKAAFDVGLRASYLPLPFVGLELEGGVMPTAGRDVDASGVMWHLRAHVIGQYPMRVTPFVVLGYGLLGISSGDDLVGSDVDGAFHVGVGGKYNVTPRIQVRLDGRLNVSGARGEGGLMPYFELLAGASYLLWYKERPKPVDTDGDGIFDPEDRCPREAANTADGCLPDGDGDGVPDARDKCPGEAAKTKDGCPRDTDGDGVPDKTDKCPKEAAKTKDGCPKDTDGDGVPDIRDKCPEVAAKTKDGCLPDEDKDGIPDKLDKCPSDPETKNGYQDEDGCPDTLPKKVKRFKGIMRGITFQWNSAVIQKRSYSTLDAAVKVIKEYPSLRIQIRGHADDTGTEQINKELSKKRADVVKEYLVSKGADASRLTTEGVGTAEPLVPGQSAAARAKNRRIEFKLGAP